MDETGEKPKPEDEQAEEEDEFPELPNFTSFEDYQRFHLENTVKIRLLVDSIKKKSKKLGLCGPVPPDLVKNSPIKPGIGVLRNAIECYRKSNEVYLRNAARYKARQEQLKQTEVALLVSEGIQEFLKKGMPLSGTVAELLASKDARIKALEGLIETRDKLFLASRQHVAKLHDENCGWFLSNRKLEKEVNDLQEKLKESSEFKEVMFRVIDTKTAELTEANSKLAAKEEEYSELAKKFEDSLKLENELKQQEALKAEYEYKMLEQEEALRQECASKLQEEKKSFEELRKVCLKLKAQVKHLRGENEKLKQESVKPEEVVEYQNKIALLEEEKGNLQLQVLDFEEIKESLMATQKKFKELEEGAESRLRLIEELNNENNSLKSKLGVADSLIAERESTISQLQENSKSMEQLKITAELKVVELEEKLESTYCEQMMRVETLEKEIENLKDYLAQQEEIIHTLDARIITKENENKEGKLSETVNLSNLPDNIPENILQELGLMRQQNEIFRRRIDELQIENENYNRFNEKMKEDVAEKNEKIGQLKEKVEALLIVISENKDRISVLEEEVKRRAGSEKQVLEASSSFDPPKDVNVQEQNLKIKKLAVNLKAKAKRCKELEDQIKTLNDNLCLKDEDIRKLNHDNHLYKQQIEDLCENIKTATNEKDGLLNERDQLKLKLNELSVSLSDRSQVEKNSAVLSSFCDEKTKDLEGIGEKLNKLELDYEKSLLKLEEKETLISNLEEYISKLEFDLNEKEGELIKLQYLKEDVVKHKSEIENLEAYIGIKEQQLQNANVNLMASLERSESTLELLKEKEQLIINLQDQFDQIKKEWEVLQNNNTLDDLMSKLTEAENLNKQYEENLQNLGKTKKEVENNLLTQVSSLQQQIVGLNEINVDLQAKICDLEQLKETSSSKIGEMEMELSELNDMKKSYSYTLDRIEILNEDLKHVRAQLESRDHELILNDEDKRHLNEKLADAEFSCTELEKQLKESEAASEVLRAEVAAKVKLMEQANHEIIHLQSQLTSYQALEDEKNAREMELANMKAYYEEQIQNYQQEKDELISILKSKVEPDIENVMEVAEETVSEMKDSQIGVFKWRDSTSDEAAFDSAKDEEDGWGWVTSDSKTEEHDVKNLKQQVNDLTLKIYDLEQAKSALQLQSSEEIKTWQNKYKALLKKTKDLKSRNEQLEKQNKHDSNSGFEDLAHSIQKDLQGKIDELEKRVHTLSSEKESWKLEKEKIEKRFENLNSATEQLIDTKERQDIELQMWQKRSNDLTNQLEALKWKLEEVSLEESKYLELEAKFSELAQENEQLQQIICQFKDQKGGSEGIQSFEDVHVQTLPQANVQNYNILKEDHRILEEKHSFILQELNSLKIEYDNVCKINTDFNTRIDQVLKEKDFLSQSLEEKSTFLGDSIRKCELLASENESLKGCLNAVTVENEKYKESLETKSKQLESIEIADLQTTVKVLKDQNETLKYKLESIADKSEVECKMVDYAQDSAALPVFKGFSTGSDDSSSFGGHRDVEIVDTLNEQLKEKENELKECRRNFEALAQEKSRLQEEVALSLKAEENAFSVKINEYQMKLSQRDQEVDSLRYEIDKIKVELSSLRNVNNEIKNREQELHVTLLNKDEEISNILSALSLKDEQLDKINIEFEELKINYKQLETDYEKLMQENSNLRLQGENSVSNLKILLEQKECKLDELQSRLLILNDQSDDMVGDLKKELESLRSEVMLKETVIRGLNQEIESLQRNSGQFDDVLLKEGAPSNVEEISQDQLDEKQVNPSSEMMMLTKHLDQALYALHDQDAKCEEMRLEIMRLLEERDTLQFKLAETLRVNESLRKEVENIRKMMVPEVHEFEKSSASASDYFSEQLSSPKISAKIGELKQVYKSDPSVHVEREARHAHQMQLYTQTTHPSEDMLESEETADENSGFFSWLWTSPPRTKPTRHT